MDNVQNEDFFLFRDGGKTYRLEIFTRLNKNLFVLKDSGSGLIGFFNTATRLLHVYPDDKADSYLFAPRYKDKLNGLAAVFQFTDNTVIGLSALDRKNKQLGRNNANSVMSASVESGMVFDSIVGLAYRKTEGDRANEMALYLPDSANIDSIKNISNKQRAGSLLDKYTGENIRVGATVKFTEATESGRLDYAFEYQAKIGSHLYLFTSERNERAVRADARSLVGWLNTKMNAFCVYSSIHGDSMLLTRGNKNIRKNMLAYIGKDRKISVIGKPGAFLYNQDEFNTEVNPVLNFTATVSKDNNNPVPAVKNIIEKEPMDTEEYNRFWPFLPSAMIEVPKMQDKEAEPRRRAYQPPPQVQQQHRTEKINETEAGGDSNGGNKPEGNKAGAGRLLGHEISIFFSKEKRNTYFNNLHKENGFLIATEKTVTRDNPLSVFLHEATGIAAVAPADKKEDVFRAFKQYRGKEINAIYDRLSKFYPAVFKPIYKKNRKNETDSPICYYGVSKNMRNIHAGSTGFLNFHDETRQREPEMHHHIAANAIKYMEQTKLAEEPECDEDTSPSFRAF